MQPPVSIVTITRNLIKAGRSKYFRQCVESVRMQDYPNIEHLIIDGASTDGTLDLFKELNLNFISEPDTGIYNACNKGIRHAKGKYIAFLSSDDFYTRPDTVSLSVKALEENNADFSYAPYNLVFPNDEVVKIIPPSWKTCFIAQPIGNPTMFTSSQLLKELNGFDENFKIAGDFDFIMRALLQGKKPVCVDKVIVSFRNSGISSLEKSILTKENIRVIETNCKISHAQAVFAQENKFLPPKILLSLLSKTVDFPDKYSLLSYNLKNFLKFVRRRFITLRLRKGKRCFRFLGITFYNEEKK